MGRGLKTTLGFPGMATGYDQSSVWGFLQTRRLGKQSKGKEVRGCACLGKRGGEMRG